MWDGQGFGREVMSTGREDKGQILGSLRKGAQHTGRLALAAPQMPAGHEARLHFLGRDAWSMRCGRPGVWGSRASGASP